MNDNKPNASNNFSGIARSEYLHPETLRYHYLDNLRALALILGVLFHASLAYMPYAHEVWIPANTEKSVTLEAMAWFSHLFRMPLFMFIAGFFGHYLLKKRGVSGFIKNRSLRVLAPLIIFLPLTFVGLIGVVVYAVGAIENKSPMLLFIMSNFTNPNPPEMPFSTLHLWFLFYLMLFYVCAIILIKIPALNISNWLSEQSPVALRLILLLALPLMIAPSFYAQASPPFQAPDKVYPELWAMGFYGVFFAMGWLFFVNRNLLDGVENYWKLMLLVVISAYAVVFLLYPNSISMAEAMNPTNDVVDPLKHTVTSVLHALIAVYMVLILLALGKKLLNTENKIYRYIADSSYWIYLVHIPVIMFIQCVLMDTDWNVWVEFVLTSVITLSIGLLSYQLLVRHTPIGWMLNGKRKKGQVTPEATPTQ